MKILNFKLYHKGTPSFEGLKTSTSQAGFTLVELLVVIGIIGILTTLGIVNHISVLERARDSQRKADLLQMQAALELYRTDVGTYPAANLLSSCSGGLVSGSVTYLRKIPCDPKGTSYYNGGVYPYSTNGSTYWITSCIENGNDTDVRVTATPPTGAPAGNCAKSKYFSVYNP